MKHYDTSNHAHIAESEGNGLLAATQGLLLALSVILMLLPSLSSAAAFTMLFSDDGGVPNGLSTAPETDADAIYFYDDATRETVVDFLSSEIGLTGTPPDINAAHVKQDGSVLFSPKGIGRKGFDPVTATVGGQTIQISPGDVAHYIPATDTTDASIELIPWIHTLPGDKAWDAIYFYESGPNQGKFLLSVASGTQWADGQRPMKAWEVALFGPERASANSYGQVYLNDRNANVDAIHIDGSGQTIISIDGTSPDGFDANDILRLTVDPATQLSVGLDLLFDAGSLYADPGSANVDAIMSEGTPAVDSPPGIDHFTIVKDETESPSECSPATITISAVDADGNLVTDYSGTIQLSTSTGQGIWSIAGVTALTTDTTTKTGETTFLGTAPTTDTTVATSDAGDGTASYTFNGAAGGDGGQVVLSLSHPEAPFVDINVTDGGVPAVTETSGTGTTDQHPVFGPCENVVGADHFVIEHSGQGINCTPASITIRAVDETGATLTNYDGTIRLTTSTNHGDWSLAPTGGSGTFVAGTADSGSAGYTFSALDQGAVTLQLAYTYQGEISINVTDGAVTERSNNGATGNDDPSLTFVAAGLRFCEGSLGACNPISTQISGKPSDVAPNQGPLYVQAIGTAADGSCEALCSGTVEVQMTYDCVDPNTCATPALAVNNTRVTERQKVVAGDFTRVPMDFGTGSDHAPFTMNYRDAGKIRLYAKIPASASTPESCQTTVARSNDLVVRPFTLGFADVKSGTTVNAEGTASSGEGFVSAGTPFGYTVSGLLWDAADDANQDGQADASANLTNNAVAPNFKEFTQTVALAVASTTPTPADGGVVGAFGGPQAINGTAFTNGSANVVRQTYSEVGSLRIEAGLQGYLGARDANISGISPVIGRFFPDRVTASGWMLTDSACGFAYMEEPVIDTEFELTAQNSFGAITKNYDPSRYDFTGTIEAVLEDSATGADLIDRTNIYVNPSFQWVDGVGSYESVNKVFHRDIVPDGPFAELQLGLSLNNEDNVSLIGSEDKVGYDMNCGPDSCSAKKVGLPISVRYGRATISGNRGPEDQDLAIPAAVEYFDGARFVTNEADSCSNWTEAQVSLRYDTLTPGLTAANIANQPIFEGNPEMTLSAPGTGNAGIVYVSMDFSAQPWLQFDWDGNALTPDSDPLEVKAEFGGRDRSRVIVWRERLR